MTVVVASAGAVVLAVVKEGAEAVAVAGAVAVGGPLSELRWCHLPSPLVVVLMVLKLAMAAWWPKTLATPFHPTW